MNILFVRGLAVLALLWLLPRLSALTLTYTGSAIISGSAGDNIGEAALFVSIPKFDPAWGSLVTVTASTHFVGSASSTEHNAYPFGFPYTYTPSVTAWSFFNVSSGLFGYTSPQVGISASEPSLTLLVNEIHTIITPLDNFVTHTFASPSDLSGFMGSGSMSFGFFNRVSGNNFFGGRNISGNETYSVIYTYTAVPEGGATLSLALMALGPLVFFHRRKTLTFRTE